MKNGFKILVIYLLAIAAKPAFGQDTEGAQLWITEGLKLSNTGRYEESVERFRQALKLDTGNLQAGYDLAQSLFKLNKGEEGIPYLQKITAVDTSLRSPACDLLGSIYFRAKQYDKAEKYAIEVLKLDPTQAGTMQMYALVTARQNKRAAAILAFCNFILLEPQSLRSGDAYRNIQHFIQGGPVRPEPGISIKPLDPKDEALNLVITEAVKEAGRHGRPADLLARQLNNIFVAVGRWGQKDTGNDFFKNYLAAYFYKLAQSKNMPAFARFISQTTMESAQWITDHPNEMDDLFMWIKSTDRGF